MKPFCFACGKLIAGKIRFADMNDRVNLHVGPDCFERIDAAKDSGGLKVPLEIYPLFPAKNPPT